MSELCDTLQSGVGQLYTCSELGRYVRIRTPFLYPDGDVIDVFRLQTPDGASLTDLGESLRWLRNQGLGQKRTTKQARLLDDIVLNHNVELFKGMLLARVREPEQLASSLTRLVQACMRVADLWFTFRTRTIETITDEIADFVRENQIPFERNERFSGRSGRVWTIDFQTRHPRRSALLSVLSTGSRPEARRQAEHTLALWHDLSHLRAGPEALRFVSLFDDTLDVWSPEDFRLLEDFSEVVCWTKTDDLLEKLAA